MNVFTGIWSKIAAVLSVIIGLLVLRVKYQSAKIEDLEDENKILSKKNELKKQKELDTAKVLAAETEELLKLTKGVKENEITLDDINSL